MVYNFYGVIQNRNKQLEFWISKAEMHWITWNQAQSSEINIDRTFEYKWFHYVLLFLEKKHVISLTWRRETPTSKTNKTDANLYIVHPVIRVNKMKNMPL